MSTHFWTGWARAAAPRQGDTSAPMNRKQRAGRGATGDSSEACVRRARSGQAAAGRGSKHTHRRQKPGLAAVTGCLGLTPSGVGNQGRERAGVPTDGSCDGRAQAGHGAAGEVDWLAGLQDGGSRAGQGRELSLKDAWHLQFG